MFDDDGDDDDDATPAIEAPRPKRPTPRRRTPTKSSLKAEVEDQAPPAASKRPRKKPADPPAGGGEAKRRRADRPVQEPFDVAVSRWPEPRAWAVDQRAEARRRAVELIREALGVADDDRSLAVDAWAGRVESIIRAQAIDGDARWAQRVRHVARRIAAMRRRLSARDIVETPFERIVCEGAETQQQNKAVAPFVPFNVLLDQVTSQIRAASKSDLRCRKCGKTGVDFDSKQTRSADEGADAWFKCDCGYRWRERG